MAKAFIYKTIFWALLCFCAPALGAQELTVLTYHDIAPDPGNDRYALSRSMFVAHMDYLQTHGYRPISLAQLEAYRKDPQRMPPKAVMLTFDDGLKSYYEFVVPVLKIYGFPSISSVVTAWMDGKDVPREYYGKLMDWNQVREVNRSPLVEVVSHTHDLHHGITSNPQGSQEAASVTRQYYQASRSYESEETFRQRIKIDLQHSMERLHKELGIRPQAVTWPYGQFDNVVSSIASDLGLHYQFSLRSGPTKLTQLPHINRIMLLQSTNINDLINELTYRWMANEKRRFSVINLDPFLDADTVEKQERLFSALLDRLEPLGLNMVVLSPFSSDRSKAFFHNSEIPVGADVLRRTVHLLDSKLGIRHIYLRLPAEIPGNNLSAVYSEMSRLTRFNGVVFDARTDATTVKFIKKLLSQVHSNLEYGSFAADGKKPEDFDFVIATVDTRDSIGDNRTRAAQLKGLATDVYLLSRRVFNISDFPFADVSQRFQALDIQHYGFQLDTTPLGAVLQIDSNEKSASSSGAGG